ncbi:hypothetical protein BKA70DRAFT_674323 [Coprinopsis sp. MPI-PUGE-AT-0042]|nr:hypothetical protein BKA70DRAFT_674323 [Coprinopsis sp. MPI-PUGE-AT-0042]
MRLTLGAAASLVAFIGQVNAGPTSEPYGDCQTGCNAIAAKCYTAAGFTFGTVAAADAPPAILACNSALASCSAVCADNHPSGNGKARMG